MKPDSISPPDGATAFTTNNDAAILAAWARHNEARTEYDNQPPSTLPHQDYTPRERELIAIIDAAELEIHRAKASTARGVEIQLWLALGHLISGKEEFSAASREDFAWFDERDEEFDWIERLILSAIRSLRAMGGAA